MAWNYTISGSRDIGWLITSTKTNKKHHLPENVTWDEAVKIAQKLYPDDADLCGRLAKGDPKIT